MDLGHKSRATAAEVMSYSSNLNPPDVGANPNWVPRGRLGQRRSVRQTVLLYARLNNASRCRLSGSGYARPPDHSRQTTIDPKHRIVSMI